MKLLLCPLIAFFASTTFGQTHAPAPYAPPPEVKVSVRSEAEDLASGFATSFASVSRTPVIVGIERGGEMRVLEDVRAMKAFGGVVVVEVGRGLTYVLNPKDIVYVTDGPAPKAKP